MVRRGLPDLRSLITLCEYRWPFTKFTLSSHDHIPDSLAATSTVAQTDPVILLIALDKAENPLVMDTAFWVDGGETQ
jgi:hypothetical protein